MNTVALFPATDCQRAGHARAVCGYTWGWRCSAPKSGAQVAERGHSFVATFGGELRRRRLPPLFCEAWTFSACLALAAACARALPRVVRPPSREASPAAAAAVPAKAAASDSPRRAPRAVTVSFTGVLCTRWRDIRTYEAPGGSHYTLLLHSAEQFAVCALEGRCATQVSPQCAFWS